MAKINHLFSMPGKMNFLKHVILQKSAYVVGVHNITSSGDCFTSSIQAGQGGRLLLGLFGKKSKAETIKQLLWPTMFCKNNCGITNIPYTRYLHTTNTRPNLRRDIEDYKKMLQYINPDMKEEVLTHLRKFMIMWSETADDIILTTAKTTLDELKSLKETELSDKEIQDEITLLERVLAEPDLQRKYITEMKRTVVEFHTHCPDDILFRDYQEVVDNMLRKLN